MSIALPPLAFGEAIATRTGDISLAASQAAETVTALRSFHSTGVNRRFQSKTVNLSINGLGLCANACTPLSAEMEASDDLYFIFSFRGDCFTEVDGRRYSWRPYETGVLIPRSGRRVGRSDDRSIVIARFDRARLESTVDAMCGRPASATAAGNLDEFRVVDLRYGPLDLAFTFRSFCSAIDSYDCSEKLLELIRFDDLFYRQLALCLEPQLLIKEAFEERLLAPAKGVIDEVCDAIKSRLHQRFTMTDMERMTGMSRRSLQTAFNRRFGCAPMEWQKRERLRVARQMLTRGSAELSVADLAFQLGFSSASRFTAFYREMFGETPKATINHARRVE